MSAKRTITACWLLLVYLLMAVGPAWASLSCRCMMHRTAVEEVAACCAHHQHHHGQHEQHDACKACEALEQAPAWSAPCCGDRHSTEIELYTNGNDDERLFASAALPASVDEIAFTAPETPVRIHWAAGSPGPLCHGSVRCDGAHAPPVQA